MTRSRGISRVRTSSTRNLARVVVAGVVVAGSPLALAGTANAATPRVSSDDVWDQIAQCESGGKWNTSTGNGYSGGLQFSPSTWRAYGGKGSASGASRAEQITVAKKVVSSQGWGAWPSCSRKVSAKAGARDTSSATSKKQSSAIETTRTEVKPNTPKPRGHSGGKYTVKAGDNLSKIADEHNSAGGWNGLYQRNRGAMSDSGHLKPGRQLDLT